MTEVITISPQSGLTSNSSMQRRSHSQQALYVHTQVPYRRSNYAPVAYASQQSFDFSIPQSALSSAPSSPPLQPIDSSSQASFCSTPPSSLSLDSQCDYLEENAILFPLYDDTPEDTHPPSTPEGEPEEDGVDQAKGKIPIGNDSKPSELAYLEVPLSSADDISLKTEPSRHVDYLSHEWHEEDIWASWRHIVGKRALYAQKSSAERTSWARLENAAWRTWSKAKYRLRTVSPEQLNWMKDHDVTWLYGPLQPASKRIGHCPAYSCLSRTNSFGTKKPILKKRSLSEMMLQKSLSSSTLMKQAVDALRAQQPDQGLRLRPVVANRTYSELRRSSSPLTSPDGTLEPPSAFTSSTSSGAQTPCEKRRIHFNDKVEQCIAINKDHEEDAINDESDSDDGAIMMLPFHDKSRRPRATATPRSSFSLEAKGKTIAMLPATTLKYRGETSEPEISNVRQTSGLWNVARSLVRSPSQETLKPAKSSSNFLLDDDDDDESDFESSWSSISPTSGIPRGPSSYVEASGASSSTNDEDDEMETRGLRRTPSGMFMPYEEDEDDIVADGLFGKVIDTVNTAKDIAHVIWNVGWRR